jgi:hypothetical protein
MNKIAAAAIAAAAIALSACGAGTPESTAEEFAENIYEGKADDALELVDVEGLAKELGSKDAAGELKGKLAKDIKRSAEEAKAEGGVKEIKTARGKCSDAGDACSVKVLVTFKSGKADDSSVTLRKVDGDWKISLI